MTSRAKHRAKWIIVSFVVSCLCAVVVFISLLGQELPEQSYSRIQSGEILRNIEGRLKSWWEIENAMEVIIGLKQ